MILKQVNLENINEIAKDLKKLFKIGNIISLNGSMGIGKTTLLKAILSEYNVSSPSFLHALYYGENFIHIDAYTLTKEKFLDLSIEDYINSKCIIVEWGDLIEDILKNYTDNLIKINLSYKNGLRYIEII